MNKYKRLFESLPPTAFTIAIEDLMSLALGNRTQLPGPVLNFWKIRLNDEDEFLIDYKGNSPIKSDMVSREYKGRKYSYVVQVPKTQESVLDLIKGRL
jgi:hypothetical protein